jgi:hypothetical protein
MTTKAQRPAKALKRPGTVKASVVHPAAAPKSVSQLAVPTITHLGLATRLAHSPENNLIDRPNRDGVPAPFTGRNAAASDQTVNDDDVLLVSPNRGRRKLGIGRSKMAAMIATGEIKSVLIGRSRRIPISEIWRIAKHGCR